MKIKIISDSLNSIENAKITPFLNFERYRESKEGSFGIFQRKYERENHGAYLFLCNISFTPILAI